MDRRKLLLVVAAVIAVLGAGMVFLYVQGADNRATEKFDGVDVLVATAPIAVGESIEQAQQAGKIGPAKVARASLVEGSMQDTSTLAGMSANTAIMPNEQIVASKFSAGVVAAASALQIPDGMMATSVQLSDTARVAGFVNPGSKIALFMNGTDPEGTFTRLVMPEVTVLGVGSTTPVATTTTSEDGGTTTEQLPRTLMTLAVTQEDAERIAWSAANGEVWFALRTDKSQVANAEARTQKNMWK